MAKHKLIVAALALGISGSTMADAQEMDAVSQSSFDTVMAFMGAMGGGDVAAMQSLMADNMVWMNEGDAEMPWIGPWRGKKAILGFLPIFGANFKVTEWVKEDAFAFQDTVAVFGRMNGVTIASGDEIGEFYFALRAKVENGQVVLWHWYEDSFAVSNAYHGRRP